MKESVIDVLMFLFDNYLNAEEGMPEDEHTLAFELEDAGFHVKDITKAFDWLGELAEIKQIHAFPEDETRTIIMNDAIQKSPEQKAIRVYLQEEQRKLDVACRGFLYDLENTGLLNSSTREIIIERTMAIESTQLSLKQFRRIVGLVMMNSTAKEMILPWVENLFYDGQTSLLH